MRSIGAGMIDWAELDKFKFSDENIAANALLSRIQLNSLQREKISKNAVDIVKHQKRPYGDLFGRVWTLK